MDKVPVLILVELTADDLPQRLLDWHGEFDFTVGGWLTGVIGDVLREQEHYHNLYGFRVHRVVQAVAP